MISSPTSRPAPRAAFSPRRYSSGPSGAAPAVIVSGVPTRSPDPYQGAICAPPVWRVSPSGPPTTTGWLPSTVAAATSSSASMSALASPSRAAGSSWASTTTSTPAYCPDTSVENVDAIIAVNMNAPAMNAVPSATATTVSAMRSLWDHRLRRLTASMGWDFRDGSATAFSPAFLGALDVGHDPRDRLEPGLGELLDDSSVGEEEHPVGPRGDAGVVGDHDDGLPVVVDRGAQDP